MATAVLEPSNSTHHAASPTELRHITSNTNLASPTKEHRLSSRTSQHLRTHRLGSRSPNSIPSSPTSVHSSSSAIFERDIEPINPSPPTLSHDPHRIPRGKNSEQLDQSVPSVLDSAAEILASSTSDDDGLDSVSIVAPISLESSQSGFTSPISRLSSRSPSPTGNRRSMLLNLPSPSPSLTLPLPMQQLPIPVPSASSPIRPTLQTNNTIIHDTPTTATPTSAYFSVHSQESSPTTATHHEHPLHSLSPSAGGASTSNTVSPISPITNGTLSLSAITTSHPPSPKNSSKRLSFISYTDLLSSTPASTLPLSSLTQLAQVSDPPPHLPSVMGFPQAQAHLLAGASGSSTGSVHGVAGVLHADRDPATGMVDDVGGEWEREGLGRGLEERLESLLGKA